MSKQATQQTPSIGRVVHYVAYGTPGGEYPAGEHRAAIITEVEGPGYVPGDGRVGLAVLNPSGLFFQRYISHDPTGKPGTWHWPEFVPPTPAAPADEVTV
jgi:hypothetical protein